MIHDSRNMIHKDNRGQSMVEMIVAITIVSVSLVGILALVNRALGAQKTISEQYTATYLASEGIEIVKNMFDHSFLLANREAPGSENFYGWVNPGETNCTYADLLASRCIHPGIYIADYNDDYLTLFATFTQCGYPGGVDTFPTEQTVRSLFKRCVLNPYLNYDENGLFTYEPGGSPTKFKRLIIIDNPPEFTTFQPPVAFNLDLRVTSAIGWETKGGLFTVQLEDHFMPWRIP